VQVKVLETDEKGRIKLSMKALLERPEGMPEEAPRERFSRDRDDRPRRDRDDRPRRERSDREDRPRRDAAPAEGQGDAPANDAAPATEPPKQPE
jgi:polyribonucleotide nucleotidyltransferase